MKEEALIKKFYSDQLSNHKQEDIKESSDLEKNHSEDENNK